MSQSLYGNHSKVLAQHESDTTSHMAFFWPHQDGHQLWSQPAHFKQLKKAVFTHLTNESFPLDLFLIL